jgi:hypothetical protein
MNYIEVQALRKQAADEFTRGVEAEAARRARISGGDPRIEKIMDEGVLKRQQERQAKAQAEKVRQDKFRAEQKAQAQARAGRVNGEIARQQRAEKLQRDKELGLTPAKTAPMHTGAPTTGTGYMKLPDGTYATITNGKITPLQSPRTGAPATTAVAKAPARRPAATAAAKPAPARTAPARTVATRPQARPATTTPPPKQNFARASFKTGPASRIKTV